MGTSRRRTPPAPVSAGPPRAPGPLIAASKKLANHLLVSRGRPGIFARGLTHGYRAPEHVFKVRQSPRGVENFSRGPTRGVARSVTAAAISWLSFDRQACNAAIPLRSVRPTG